MAKISNMRKIYLLSLSLCFVASLQAQWRMDGEDNFFFNFTSGSFLMSEVSSLDQSLWGPSVDLEFMKEYMVGEKQHWGFAWGLGYSWEEYRNNLNFSYDLGRNNQYRILEDSAFSRNMQRVQYLRLPLELRWRSGANAKGKHWRLYLGASLGLRTFSSAELRREDNYRVTHYRFDDFERFRADAYFRLGFSYFNLYARYALTPIISGAEAEYRFIAEDGSETTIKSDLSSLRPLQVGLSFSF